MCLIQGGMEQSLGNTKTNKINLHVLINEPHCIFPIIIMDVVI